MLTLRIRVLLGLSILLAAACTEDHRPAVVSESVRQALHAAPSRPLRVAVGLRANQGEREDLLGDAARITEATDEIRGLLEGSGASVTETFSEIPGIRVDLPSSEALELLAEHPNVDIIDFDEGGGASLDASRAFVGVDRLYSEDVVGVGQDGRVKVAVIDTGINRAHRSFGDGLGGSRIVDRACFCATDRVGDKCCPDDPNPTDAQPGRFVDDDSGHGTHVAGIVGGNGVGSPRGIAPGVDLVIVRAMNDNVFDSLGDIIRALNWIADKHPDVAVVNMSLGTRSTYVGACDTATVTNLDLRDSVERIRRNGGVVTVSTGNDGQRAIQSPACLSNTIAVGNADILSPGAPSPYWSSNGGPGLDLFAPGTDIVSAYRGVRDAQGVMTGTSMAAPHVAGAVALMRQLHPTAPVEAIEQCLRADTQRMIGQYGLSRPMLDVPASIACVGRSVDACVGSTLHSREHLAAGQRVCSRSGAYQFGLSATGDLTLSRGGRPLWRAGVSGGVVLIMQGDGNLVVRDASGASRWSARTHGNLGAALNVAEDGNVSVRASAGPLWQTGVVDACVGEGLARGARLQAGQFVCAAAGAYRFGLDADGDLVLLGLNQLLWHADIVGGAVVVMQGDGNLVVKDAGGAVLWSSRTSRNPGADLKLRQDGSVVVQLAGRELWRAPR